MLAREGFDLCVRLHFRSLLLLLSVLAREGFDVRVRLRFCALALLPLVPVRVWDLMCACASETTRNDAKRCEVMRSDAEENQLGSDARYLDRLFSCTSVRLELVLY